MTLLNSAVLCGLQMAATSIDAQLGWAVRVGVHIGPVVAGIVGQERYQFDIWGDTVNIAARMAGKAMPGGVAVTDETWRQIKDRFEGELLGDLEVKGKGTIRIVAVQARSAKYSSDQDSESIKQTSITSLLREPILMTELESDVACRSVLGMTTTPVRPDGNESIRSHPGRRQPRLERLFVQQFPEQCEASASGTEYLNAYRDHRHTNPMGMKRQPRTDPRAGFRLPPD